jgi:hypothetical protein
MNRRLAAALLNAVIWAAACIMVGCLAARLAEHVCRVLGENP